MLDIRSAPPGRICGGSEFLPQTHRHDGRGGISSALEKYVYPSDDFLRSSIERGELYVGMLGEEIAVAMVINGEGADGYDGAPWRVRAADGEFSVIHALGVLPPHHGRGFARELVRAAIDKTRAKGMKALRLDVLNGNLPAVRLYESEEFRLVSRVKLFYEGHGADGFSALRIRAVTRPRSAASDYI